MNSVSLIALFPEFIILITTLAIIIIDLVYQDTGWLSKIAIGGLILASAGLVFQWLHPVSILFWNSYEINNLTTAFRCLITWSVTLCVVIADEYMRRSGMAIGEFLIFILIATLGSLFLCGANDLLTLFVALECLSLSSYLLAGYSKLDIRSNEAAIKYLLMGGGSSAILAYGFSWLYGLSGGKLQLPELVTTLSQTEHNIGALSLALVCSLVAIAFKLGAVPFHQWAPDVYEGSPTPVVAFFSVASKVASLALAARVCSFIFPSISWTWGPIVSVLAILTMSLGNLIALTQTSLKRLLAYSSISQAGYLLISLLYADQYTPMIVYLFAYLFTNLGAFACAILLGLRTGTDQIRDYSGLYFRDPALSICLTICFLSLAGIPPFAGFFTKLYLFWFGWKNGLYVLVYVGLVTSVISLYYYLRVIKIFITKEAQETSDYVAQYPIGSIFSWPKTNLEYSIVVCVIVSSTLGLVLNPILDMTMAVNTVFIE